MDCNIKMQQNRNSRIVAIGNFDGLHLGHRALLEELHNKSAKMNLTAGVMTFEPHPLKFFSGKGPDLFFTKEQKRDFLYRFFAVDEVYFLPFDSVLANLSPRQFVQEILVDKYNCRHVIVGFNFLFAKDVAGNAELLRDICRDYDINVSIIPPVVCNYGLISSSSIRAKLVQGDLEAANSMLGYCYFISGKVIKGQQLGRTIDFPTANIVPPEHNPLPAYGVYAVRGECDGQTWDGMANLGYRPTVARQKQLLLEVHLFNEKDLDLYGRELRIYFCHHLRPERCFSNFEQLKDQLTKDYADTKRYFEHFSGNQHLPKPIK
ncbi:MAG: riboflavin biosynthesis protein RibF [Bacillota bacterium]|jgi:riboflavin kinase/FMN adenylyltransferase